jgi:catechol 2,3-dioxygenase
MTISRLLHVELAVGDIDSASAFHKEAFGLEETAREGDTAYLAPGGRGEYVVALTGGGTGVRHFAVAVNSEEDLSRYEKRLGDMGVGTERSSDGEPGQGSAVRFRAPSGHAIELVAAPDASDAAPGGAVGARGLDHITLRTPDVRGLAEFLCSALDCKVSDAFSPAPEIWGAAWTRFGDLHHDIAIIGGPPGGEEFTLDHLAWRMDGMEHVKTAADGLSELEVPLEVGPGRHRLGGNLFAYFWAAGNRYELSAEMPRVEGTEPEIWTDFGSAFSAWGHQPPESFARGS